MAEMISLVLGDWAGDPARLEMAQQHCGILQAQHLDTEGAQKLREFLELAAQAKKFVDEGNEITQAVKPQDCR